VSKREGATKSTNTVTAVAAAVTYAIVSPFADLSLALDCKYHICPKKVHEKVRIHDKLITAKSKDPNQRPLKQRRLTSCFVFAIPIHFCSIYVLKRGQEEEQKIREPSML
jgi:hypothetical protein